MHGEDMKLLPILFLTMQKVSGDGIKHNCEGSLPNAVPYVSTACGLFKLIGKVS